MASADLVKIDNFDDCFSSFHSSSSTFRGLKVWKMFAKYFPLDLIKTVDLDPSRNYLFCAHPHGLVCNGAFGSFATDGLGFNKLFPGLSPHLLTVEFYYWMPFTREFFLSLGKSLK